MTIDVPARGNPETTMTGSTTAHAPTGRFGQSHTLLLKSFTQRHFIMSGLSCHLKISTEHSSQIVETT
jgi:hypothetical protein